MALAARRCVDRARPLFACSLSILCAVGPLSAEAEDEPTRTEEVVVTASRVETSPLALASSVTVVDRDQIDGAQDTFATGALQGVPGLDVAQSGGPGGNSAVFLRGMDSGDTLVLLDGIELNNPASPNRAFNFSSLTLDDIDRIEVVRGPQSTLYGSDAIGGVVNLISKRAQPGFHSSASAEAGSYNSFTETSGASWGGEASEVTAGVTRQDIGSVSAADAKFGNREDDDFENTSATTRARVYPSELIDFGVTARYNDSRSSLDNNGGPGADDPNRRLKNTQYFTRGDATTHLLDDTLSQTASVSYSHHDLSDDNNPDLMSPEYLRSDFTGDLLKLNGVNKWTPTKSFSFVAGGETERERASSTYSSDGAFGPYEDDFLGRSARTNAFFTEAQGSYKERAFLDGGFRIDDHSQFGKKTTFRIAPAVIVVEGTKLRGSVGTGFKAPSLVQLYSSFGNPNLQPEQSVGWDVGIDQTVIEKEWTTSLTYFRNNLTDLITFNSSTFVLENVNKAETSGFEFSSEHTLSEFLSLRGSYTYTDTKDAETGQPLLRRPRNKGMITLSYSPTSRLSAQVQWQAYGGRYDNDFSTAEPTRVRLGGYGLVDFAAAYKVTESVSLTTRIENLFDKEYEQVYGYGTLGLAAYGGVKVSL